jgi:hypothetical protein
MLNLTLGVEQSSLLHRDDAQHVGCVELTRLIPQDRFIHGGRLPKTTGLMKCDSLWQQWMDAGFARRQRILLGYRRRRVLDPTHWQTARGFTSK